MMSWGTTKLWAPISLIFIAGFVVLSSLSLLEDWQRASGALGNIFIATLWILILPDSLITLFFSTIALGFGIWLSVRNV